MEIAQIERMNGAAAEKFLLESSILTHHSLKRESNFYTTPHLRHCGHKHHLLVQNITKMTCIRRYRTDVKKREIFDRITTIIQVVKSVISLYSPIASLRNFGISLFSNEATVPRSCTLAHYLDEKSFFLNRKSSKEKLKIKVPC